jgi:hypothetical protein
MHTNTEFYDLQNAAVLGWTAAIKRACDKQPTSRPDLLTADTICAVTGLLPLYSFDVPAGMVATGPMSIDIVDGAAYKRYATITIEEYEAQRAAREAEQAAADAQAAIDAAAERKAAMAAKLTTGIVGLAMAYRAALRAMFPKANPDDEEEPFAEVNHAITEDTVATAMLLLPPEQYDAKTADMLKLAFEKLSAIAGDGTTWTFFETVGDLIPEAQV